MAGPRPVTVARIALLAVVAACGAYVISTLPHVRPVPGYSRLWEVGCYNTVITGAALVVLARAALVRRSRLGWSLLGLGLASYSAGTWYFSLHLQHLAVIPYPSLSDGLWLAFYPAALAGIVVLTRDELADRGSLSVRPATLLDGLIAGLAIAATSAAFAFDRITGSGAGTPIEILTNFAYPIADLALLTLVASFVVVLGRQADTRWWYLAAGFAAFAAADTWFLLEVAADTYQPGSLVDATWAVAVTLMAAGAWQAGRGRHHEREVGGIATVLVPALCGLGALTVLVAGQLTRVSTVGVLLASATMLAVFARLIQALHQAMRAADSLRQARTDDLTGLPNRRWFYELLAAAETAPLPGPKTVLLLDLDRFKEVNDALGHSTGDELLRQVSRRLQQRLPGPHQIARLGGDEFAVLVDGGLAVAEEIAELLLGAVREPYDVGLMSLHLDGSVGVARLVPGTDPGRSLARADIAMYQAKTDRTDTHVYQDTGDSTGWDRLAQVEALRHGLAAGELDLEFQPVVDTVTGRPRGLEALVRWRHPTQGTVMPDDFLPLAEQTGLMHDVTMTVLRLALDHAVRLRTAATPMPIAVNLSASDLLDSALPADIIDGLAARALPSSALRLEITETLIVSDRTRSDPVLEQLHGAGIEVAVDDYGTGYSSLAYLHDLPVAELKIDRIFTDRVLTDRRTALIVRSTVELAHSLGLRVVAEGVETAEQLEWMRVADVDAIQGWHVGRPMSAEASLQWLGQCEVEAMVAEPTTSSPS